MKLYVSISNPSETKCLNVVLKCAPRQSCIAGNLQVFNLVSLCDFDNDDDDNDGDGENGEDEDDNGDGIIMAMVLHERGK